MNHQRYMAAPFSAGECLHCQRLLLLLIVDWLETLYIYTHCSMVDIELASGFVETVVPTCILCNNFDIPLHYTCMRV